MTDVLPPTNHGCVIGCLRLHLLEQQAPRHLTACESDLVHVLTSIVSLSGESALQHVTALAYQCQLYLPIQIRNRQDGSAHISPRLESLSQAFT